LEFLSRLKGGARELGGIVFDQLVHLAFDQLLNVNEIIVADVHDDHIVDQLVPDVDHLDVWVWSRNVFLWGEDEERTITLIPPSWCDLSRRVARS
jgi:hypothetical protein